MSKLETWVEVKLLNEDNWNEDVRVFVAAAAAAVGAAGASSTTS